MNRACTPRCCWLAFVLLVLCHMEQNSAARTSASLGGIAGRTGDDPMTAAQRSALETLCRETGEEFDATLTKAEAAELMDVIQTVAPLGEGGDR
jgi:hypothetical protein